MGQVSHAYFKKESKSRKSKVVRLCVFLGTAHGRPQMACEAKLMTSSRGSGGVRRFLGANGAGLIFALGVFYVRHAEIQQLFRELARARTVAAREAVARMLKEPRLSDPRRLEHFGWRAYSQNEEDGIIAEIFKRLGTTDRRFLEIGVGDGLENNTAYLLMQGWSGAWIEANAKNAQRIRKTFAAPLASGQLRFGSSFVTRENVNDLIGGLGLRGDIDFVSIDIDGNDYYMLEVLKAVSPRVIAIEYNATFAPPVVWVNRYDPARTWDGGNAFGASLAALTRLANSLGYTLVGTGLTGINAFFVRSGLVGDSFAGPFTSEALYNPSAYELQDAFRSGHPAAWGAGGDPGSVF